MANQGQGKKVPGKPFQKGQSGNPNGRPKGSRNKLSEQFVADLQEDWEENGAEVIKQVRAEKPDVYMKVISQILPKDVNVTHGLEEDLKQMPEETIKERLEQLYEQLGGADAITASISTDERTH